MTKPVVVAPPAPPPAPVASRAQPLGSYLNKQNMLDDIAALKLNTAVLLDNVVVVEGFGPPFLYATQGGGVVVRL